MKTPMLQPGDIELAQQTAAEAARILEAGGLIVFPTETVYGIGASAASGEGLAKLRAFKGREDGQPFTVHVPDVPALDRYFDTAKNALAARLIRKTLPGPVTLIVEQPEHAIDDKIRAMIEAGCFGDPEDVSEQRIAEIRDRMYHEGTIGLRVPDMPIAQRVLASIDAPIVASSANRKGDRPPTDADSAMQAVGDAAALVIDGGNCRYAKPSTILRIQSAGPDDEFGHDVSVLREGVLDQRIIDKLGVETVLIVCSGNTCRSPMGQAIAAQVLAEDRGTTPDKLPETGVQVLSAGTSAFDGMPASPEAVDVMHRMGVDISRHRSTALSPQLLFAADAVYCMTQNHRRAVLSIAPELADRVHLVDPDGDVSDPIGGSLDVYQRCAEQIKRGLSRQLKEQPS